MIELLKQLTLTKYAGTLGSAKECKLLAAKIVAATNRNISDSTIRRIFGLLPSSSSLSNYNLDTLAVFCGFTNYLDFTTKQNTHNTPPHISFDSQHAEIQKITHYTLKNIEHKTLTNFKNTIPRDDVNKKIDAFLESDFGILPIVAPGGYGKSVALCHWVMANTGTQNTVLFCSASFLAQLIFGKNDTAATLNFKPDAAQNIFNRFASHQSATQAKFILVIDAFEDVISDEKQLQTLIDFLCQTIELSQKYDFIKVIVNTRITTWNNIILPNLYCGSSGQRQLQLHEITESTIPTLTATEICAIINKMQGITNGIVLYNSLSWFIKEMIPIPINLYLFLNIYNQDSNCTHLTRNSLYKAYLNKTIFASKYAESKEDIIWELLAQLEKQGQYFEVNKGDLKNTIPVHLKRESNYYNAYNQLINDSFLMEERTANRYGIYTTTIKFKHQVFYNYLEVLFIIKKNGVLNAQLFREIAAADKPLPWKTFVVALLFEIAYESKDYDALMHFCDLPDEVLQLVEVRMSVGFCFRIHNGLRDRLIAQFAASPKGQTYFFEQFVDINYLFNNYEYRITAYLQHKQTKEATLFGNNILFTAGFLGLNTLKCQRYFSIIDAIAVEPGIHPWPIGRKTANTILYQHYIAPETPMDLNRLISENRAIAYDFPGYLDFGLVEFELMIMVALCLTNNFKLLNKLLADIDQQYHLKEHQVNLQGIMYSNQNKLHKVFLAYSNFKLGNPVQGNIHDILLDAAKNFYGNIDDYQYRILVLWFLSDYYAQTKSKKLAVQYWEQAFELSKSAYYTFYLVWLLINHPLKPNENIAQAKALLNQTGFYIEPFLA